LISAIHFFILIEDGKGTENRRNTIDPKFYRATCGGGTPLLAILRQLRNEARQPKVQIVLPEMRFLSFMQRTIILNSRRNLFNE
jgi:hypothetical protein